MVLVWDRNFVLSSTTLEQTDRACKGCTFPFNHSSFMCFWSAHFFTLRALDSSAIPSIVACSSCISSETADAAVTLWSINAHYPIWCKNQSWRVLLWLGKIPDAIDSINFLALSASAFWALSWDHEYVLPAVWELNGHLHQYSIN